MGQLVLATRSELSEKVQKATGNQERLGFSDALRELDLHEPELTKSYPMALLEVFSEGSSAPKAQPALDSGMDFGELTLMDDSAVMAQVELARAQQIADHVTDAALADLNVLVSSAQGLANVQPERNPFRPENYIRALQQVVSDTGVSSEIRQLWMQHMREILSRELVPAYQRVSSSLREHGIKPVGYTVAAGPAGVRSGASQATAASRPARELATAGGHTDFGYPATDFGATGYMNQHAGQPWGQQAMAANPQEAMLAAGILRQMLAAGGDPFAYDGMTQMSPMSPMSPMSARAPAAAMPAAAGSLSASQQAAMAGFTAAEAAETMQDIQALERIVGRLSGIGGVSGVVGGVGGVGGSVNPGAPAAGHTMPPGASTTHWAQASMPASLSGYGALSARSAAEVLSRMMDHISHDSRLLAPVQRAVQNLEPSLKQLVRIDPSFFSNENHPARRLLDSLTERSLSFTAENSQGFSRYIQLVNAAVQHLSTVDIKDAKPFEQVSVALESAWATQMQQLRKQEEMEKQDLMQVERQELLAVKIAKDFRRLAQSQKVPADILDFVSGPWADVAAQAQISAQPGDGDDPGGYLAVVPPLLWCAQESHSRAGAQRLLPMLDGMLFTLRNGLVSIHHPDDQITELLQRVAGLKLAVAQRAQEPEVAPQTDFAASAKAPARALAHVDIDIELDDEESEAAETRMTSFEALSTSTPAVDVLCESAVDNAAPYAEERVESADSAEFAESADPGKVESASSEVTTEAKPSAFAVVGSGESYEIGQWLEISTNQRVVRTQLTWASPHNTLFLFTALDASTQSMTRRMLDKLTAEGALTKIADQRVVSRALGAVVAERKSAGVGSGSGNTRR